jgi:hypothetical protein
MTPANVERTYAAELLSDGRGGVGYLLKDRVADVRDFVDALRRVAEGGTALDPEAVSQLLGQRDDGPLDAVEKHVSNIFMKLGLPPSDQDHRRVRAVLAWLQA